MPLTHFPNGVTTQTNSAANASAGAGDLNCQDLFVDGTVTAAVASVTGNASITGTLTVGSVSPTGSLIGQNAAVIVQFTTGSAAQVYSAAVPFNGNLVAAYVTIGSVSAVASQYTVRLGSGGTILVASVTNTLTAAYSQEGLAIASATVTTASGLSVTRAVQGTAGDTALTLVFQVSA